MFLLKRLFHVVSITMFLKLQTVVFHVLMVIYHSTLVQTSSRQGFLSGGLSKCATSCVHPTYLNVMWTEFEPYAYRKSNNKIGGIIPGISVKLT